MALLVDANNLAGKIGILKEKDFDKILIDIIKEYIGRREKKVVLVFDGPDSLGDKYSEGSLTIIYSPKDKYCKNADDKIVEIINSPEIIGSRREEINVVTDDNEILKVAEEKDCKTLSSEVFSERLNLLLNPNEEDDENNLNKEDIDKINKELLKEWS